MESSPCRTVTLIAALVSAAVIVLVPLGLSRVTTAGGQTHTFVIPAGTADRVSAGEEVTIIPTDLRMRLRDELVVINEDDTTHQIASITVGAGERVATRFSEAISLSGYCSVHPSGQITIEVQGTLTEGGSPPQLPPATPSPRAGTPM